MIPDPFIVTIQSVVETETEIQITAEAKNSSQTLDISGTFAKSSDIRDTEKQLFAYIQNQLDQANQVTFSDLIPGIVGQTFKS